MLGRLCSTLAQIVVSWRADRVSLGGLGSDERGLLEVDLSGSVYLKEKTVGWAPLEVLTEDRARGQAGVRRA